MAGGDYDGFLRLVDQFPGQLLELGRTAKESFDKVQQAALGPSFTHTDISNEIGADRPVFVAHRTDAVGALRTLLEAADTPPRLAFERRRDADGRPCVSEPWTGKMFCDLQVRVVPRHAPTSFFQTSPPLAS